jgi:hypothetical protein
VDGKGGVMDLKSGENISRAERLRTLDVHMDRLDALQNLVFLMRIDVTKPESLTLYLQYMDRILDGMIDDEIVQRGA